MRLLYNFVIVISLLFSLSSVWAKNDSPPADVALKKSIERGRYHFFHDSFGSKKQLNNQPFTCSICHAGDSGSGRWPTLQNAAAIFPKYNATIKTIVTLETQIQRCVKGGIGGKPPANSSKEIVDMLTYLQSIAKGQKIEVGGKLLPIPNTARGNQGETTFNSSCFGCHGTGVAGAPIIGDAKAWKKRLEKTVPVLYAHAITGFKGKSGVMPPKGGNSALTDKDIMAAVNYMLAQLSDTRKD